MCKGMQTRLTISVYSIIGILLYIITFFSTKYFNYNALRYLLIVLVAIMLVAKAPKSVFVDNLRLNALVILFLAATLWSSFSSNYGTDRNLRLASIVFCVVFAELVMFLEIMAKKNMTLFCIKTWYRCAIVISLLTDILALTQGSIDGNYFVGTKFAVVYQHLFLLTLFMMVNSSSLMKKNSLNNYRVRFTFYALLILTIILSLYVDCMTGVIGTALFFVFSLLVRYNSKMMASGGMFIGAVLASFAFMWVVPSILLNENVASFITNKLNRSLSLTGRTLIFERIPQIMQGKWLLGFGYGSSYEICRRYIGFADTQNALMEWIMQIGVLGSALLCLMLCYCITRLNKNIMIYTEWVWPLAFVYTYVALGTIEITYSYQFIGALLILYALSKDKESFEMEMN